VLNERGRNGAGGAFGLLINKRSLRRLEIPVRHEINADAGGWRLDVLEAGKVTAYYAKPADHESIDLEPGDYLLAAGEDVYVCVQRLKVREKPSREDEDREAS
jgi:hypothetical protein